MGSTLDILMATQEVTEDGKYVWWGLYSKSAVRNQPTMLFRFKADAELYKGTSYFTNYEVKPVTITERL